MATRAPIGEETFFLECMWEKLIWIMGEQWLFKTTPTTDVLDEMRNLVFPLGLSDYRNQSMWVQESFVVVKLKFQFLRFIIALEYGKDSARLKDSLVGQFFKNWRASAETHRDQTTLLRCCDRTLLRTLSANLWSEFLELLAECGVVGEAIQSVGIGRTTLEIISSIHSIIELIPEAESVTGLPIELWHLIDMAIYCLPLVGLVISDMHPKEESGSSITYEKLRVVVFDLTRSQLLISTRRSNCFGNEAFISSFDRSCLVLSSQPEEQERVGSRAVTEWIGLV